MIKEFFRFMKYENWMGRVFSFWSSMSWTYIGFFFPLFGFISVASGHITWGVILFLIGGLIDEIDGKVGRYSGRTAYWGGFMDGVIDRFSDFFFILSFFYLDFPDWIIGMDILLLLLLFTTIMPPFIVAYANHRKTVPDPTEKVIWRFSFRIEYYFLFIFVLFFNPISTGVSFALLLAILVLHC